MAAEWSRPRAANGSWTGRYERHAGGASGSFREFLLARGGGAAEAARAHPGTPDAFTLVQTHARHTATALGKPDAAAWVVEYGGHAFRGVMPCGGAASVRAWWAAPVMLVTEAVSDHDGAIVLTKQWLRTRSLLGPPGLVCVHEWCGDPPVPRRSSSRGLALTRSPPRPAPRSTLTSGPTFYVTEVFALTGKPDALLATPTREPPTAAQIEAFFERRRAENAPAWKKLSAHSPSSPLSPSSYVSRFMAWIANKRGRATPPSRGYDVDVISRRARSDVLSFTDGHHSALVAGARDEIAQLALDEERAQVGGVIGRPRPAPRRPSSEPSARAIRWRLSFDENVVVARGNNAGAPAEDE